MNLSAVQTFRIIALFIGLLSAGLAQAAPEADEAALRTRLEDARSKVDAASDRMGNWWTSVRDSAGRISTQVYNAAKAQYQSVGSDLADIRGRFSAAAAPIFDPSTAQTTLAEAQTRQAKSEELEAQARRERAALGTAFREQSRAVGTATSEAYRAAYQATAATVSAQTRALAVRTHDAALAAELRASDVDSGFQNLMAKYDDIDYTLDVMNRYYDKSLMGAYLKDKIGQLLNSNAMCKAQKRCSVAEPKPIPNEEINNELFPSTSSSSRKGKYYDAVRRGETK